MVQIANYLNFKNTQSRSVFGRLIIFVGFFILLSCVTVNVNFPEGAVQKAADDYVKELYRVKQETEKSGEKKGSSFWWYFSNEAYADMTFKTDSPEVKVIQVKQADRLGKIDKYKVKGYIVEGEKGLLELNSQVQPKKLELKAVSQLIDGENEDRKALYEAVIKTNGLNSGELVKVQNSFSNSFIQASPAGTYFIKNGKLDKK